MNKSQAILYIYSRLTINGSISKKKAMESLGINELTLRRYISDIRDYMKDYDINNELIYSRKLESYIYRRKGI